MKSIISIFAVLLPLLMLGCGSPVPRGGAPVTEADPNGAPVPPEVTREAAKEERSPVARDQSGVEVTPLRAPPPQKAEPVNSKAVAGLISKAEQQQRSDNLTGAAATLERALRIEPRNAHLWHRLARLRLDQKRYAQAEDLAAKSNSLAGGDEELRFDNWRVITRARRLGGEAGSARGETYYYEDY